MMNVLLILALSLLPLPDSLSNRADTLSAADSLISKAREMHSSYRFADAVSLYSKVAETTTDSLKIREADSLGIFSRNAFSLAQVCARPKVLERGRFDKTEFTSYYPLPQEDRDRLSSPLDSLIIGGDTLEVLYPLESGGNLYFSSRELFGIGGYDLYRCRRNPYSGKWGEPENLGFPFCSPSDDFLLFSSPEGQIYFASDRFCPADGVNVYVLESEVLPLHESISDPAELKALCALEPAVPEREISPAEKAALEEYRLSADTLARHRLQLDAMRRRYSSAGSVERGFLAKEISVLEAGLPALVRRQKAAAARKESLKIEAPAPKRGRYLKNHAAEN